MLYSDRFLLSGNATKSYTYVAASTSKAIARIVEINHLSEERSKVPDRSEGELHFSQISKFFASDLNSDVTRHAIMPHFVIL